MGLVGEVHISYSYELTFDMIISGEFILGFFAPLKVSMVFGEPVCSYKNTPNLK